MGTAVLDAKKKKSEIDYNEPLGQMWLRTGRDDSKGATEGGSAADSSHAGHL